MQGRCQAQPLEHSWRLVGMLWGQCHQAGSHLQVACVPVPLSAPLGRRVLGTGMGAELCQDTCWE